jgi:formylglycine-generating enzyme required for sulfatase activity
MSRQTRRPLNALALVQASVLAACLSAAAAAADRVEIPGGDFRPTLAPPGTIRSIHVESFLLDRRPVTLRDFEAFLASHPEWRRGNAPSLFVDERFLSRWSTPEDPGPGARPAQPVTEVSWYAARAYCEASGGRLPTWREWEYAAAADESARDARSDPAWQERILGWYSHAADQALPDVGAGHANAYGVQDLEGLVWEWVEDFSSLMAPADGRNPGSSGELAFCGGGAAGVLSKESYAILMRVAMLSSLEARYTTGSLGFRCAAGSAPR